MIQILDGALAAIFLLLFCAKLVDAWPIGALYLTGLSVVLEYEFPNAISVVTFSGIEVKLQDILSIVFLISVLKNPGRMSARFKEVSISSKVLLACFVASLLRGVFEYGPSGVNEAREFIWLLAFTVWLSNQNIFIASMEKNLLRFVQILGFGIALPLIIHVASTGFGSADTFMVEANGEVRATRPLRSNQAWVLLGTGLTLIRARAEKQSTLFWAQGWFYILCALVSQNRSVGIACAGALLFLFVSSDSVRKTRLAAVAGFTFIAGLIFIAYGGFNRIIADFQNSLTSTGTLDGRLDTWQVLVTDSISRGPASILFGEPFGFGYDRVSLVSGLVLSFPPHNWYVSVYLRLGLLGLGAFLILLARFAAWIYKSQDMAVGSIYLSLLIYMTFYAVAWYAPLLAVSLQPLHPSRRGWFGRPRMNIFKTESGRTEHTKAANVGEILPACD